jgi:hypothetical protein
MPGHVAGRGQGGQLAGEAVLALHELDQPQLGQRPDAGRGVHEAGGLHIGLVTGLPVLDAYPVAGPGKRGDVLLALGAQVPAHVVAVQVGHHGGGDRFFCCDFFAFDKEYYAAILE